MVRILLTVYWTWQLNQSIRNSLSDGEKAAYIDAELCLMSSPPKLDIEGAQNRWDEIMYAHIVQSNVIHDVVRHIRLFRYLR